MSNDQGWKPPNKAQIEIDREYDEYVTDRPRDRTKELIHRTDTVKIIIVSVLALGAVLILVKILF